MINIFYWSPCLEKVGTYKSTINSALSIGKYSKKKFSINVINVCGEWEKERKLFEDNNVNLIDIGFNFFKYLPRSGYFSSRFSYIFIAIMSFIPLIKLLIKKKPHFFVSHLLTSVPFIIFYFFKFKTKLILRISGFPRLTFFRKFLWKICSKKIFKVTFPSVELLNQLSDLNIFHEKQLIFLPDPILNIKEYIRKKKTFKKNFINSKNRNFFISAGRLTKQKNFSYLIKEFKKFSDKNEKIDLLIFGLGEEKEKLNDLIKELHLNKRVFLMGYTEYIYEYMRKSQAFILSSLWEDPGFVIIEAAFNNSLVISSNCKNGPSEFLEYGRAGILFENNIKNSLFNALEIFVSRDFDKRSKKFLAKKNCLKYSLLRHNNIIKNIFLN
tara:strand:- start:391 stop:1539 length:1149 start_codon:yes stop_codon:yes gene_type:complete